MTATEYDIIDELYFVTSYSDISKNLGLEYAQLNNALTDLIGKGFIKCFFPDTDNEIEFDETNFKANYTRYFFLATKAGLIAHNSR